MARKQVVANIGMYYAALLLLSHHRGQQALERGCLLFL